MVYGMSRDGSVGKTCLSKTSHLGVNLAWQHSFQVQESLKMYLLLLFRKKNRNRNKAMLCITEV